MSKSLSQRFCQKVLARDTTCLLRMTGQRPSLVNARNLTGGTETVAVSY